MWVITWHKTKGWHYLSLTWPQWNPNKWTSAIHPQYDDNGSKRYPMAYHTQLPLGKREKAPLFYNIRFIYTKLKSSLMYDKDLSILQFEQGQYYHWKWPDDAKGPFLYGTCWLFCYDTIWCISMYLLPNSFRRIISKSPANLLWIRLCQHIGASRCICKNVM